MNDVTAEQTIVHADNLAVMSALPSASMDLVYADPPFNTGSRQVRATQRMIRDDAGSRAGYAGRRYSVTNEGPAHAFNDQFDDYLGWLAPRLEESHRLLTDEGTLYLHVDAHEAHYCKVLLDEIFGRACFLNEVIWAYDFGGRGTRRWAAKHDTILVYVRDPQRYHFDASEVERIPYMAPSLQTPERAARGKLPTDVWWHTIVPTSSRERTGYPTQKPVGLLRRIVTASSRPGNLVLDWCAGSGTTGAACVALGRRSLLIDSNEAAVEVMRCRLPAASLLGIDDLAAWSATRLAG